MSWGGPRPFDEQYVRNLLESLPADFPQEPPRSIELCTEHSNDLATVHFADGRTLVVKRARYPEMAGRFLTDQLASRLLRERTSIVTPIYEVIEDPFLEPVLVYWWLPQPTLAEVWQQLTGEQQREALRDWGRLFRGLHGIRLPGHGLLLSASEKREPLAAFLHSDLEIRLRPAVATEWPAGLPVLDRLIATSPEVAARASDHAVLLHGDLFSANVLCTEPSTPMRCVGVLDFENAFAGPPEADLAKTELLHGPLFGQPWSGDWLKQILDGYETEPDPFLTSFFRVYHLLNMGYYASATGLHSHADEVARVAARETEAMGSGTTHAALVAECRGA